MTNVPSKYTTITDSTILQEETERECRPFFIDLSALPKSQLDHLRDIGLLPSLPSTEETEEEGEEDEIEISLDEAETQIKPIAAALKEKSKEEEEDLRILLLRKKHTNFCMRGITKPLHPNFVSLDASHTWMIYWLLHSLDLMNALPSTDVLQSISAYINKCWNDETGGFGGGIGQMSHCATTYAAVLALVICATEENNKEIMTLLQQKYALKLQSWFLTLFDSTSGGYRMQIDGEVDVRAYYCIVSVSALLNILHDDFYTNASYILQCQTYEGGFGGEPWNEAHGGYTYCALSALTIMNLLHKINLGSCRSWLAFRQMSFEGGFSGRANKLVDGCYSFWQGASLSILDIYYNNTNHEKLHQKICMRGYHNEPLSMNQAALQKYILLCAQNFIQGGLRDKPSKNSDFYHTCYNISGLSVAQFGAEPSELFGHDDNVLKKTHPLFNIQEFRVTKMIDVFYSDTTDFIL